MESIVIMKKFIQLFSLLGLLFFLTTVTISAQSEYGKEVHIPFNFTFGDRNYEAGKYFIQVTHVQSGSAAISIADKRDHTFQRVFAQRNGEETEGKLDFVFENIAGTRTLSRIVTPDGGFAINGLRQRREATAAAAKKSTRTENVGSSDLF